MESLAYAMDRNKRSWIRLELFPNQIRREILAKEVIGRIVNMTKTSTILACRPVQEQVLPTLKKRAKATANFEQDPVALSDPAPLQRGPNLVLKFDIAAKFEPILTRFTTRTRPPARLIDQNTLANE
jgi:hypothetical protein